MFCNREVTVLKLNSGMQMFQVVFLSHHETAGVVLSLSTHCSPFSTALILNSKLTSLSDIALILSEFKRLTWSSSGLSAAKQRVPQCSPHKLDPHKNTQRVKPEIQQAFQIQLKDLQKHRFSIQRQIARIPLDAY